MSYAGLTRVSIDLSERLFSKDDGLPEAQTSLGSLRKADSCAQQRRLQVQVACAAVESDYRTPTIPLSSSTPPDRYLDVDLEAEVDFGRRHAAAQAPIFGRSLDQRNLDIVWRNIKPPEITYDALVESALDTHRSPAKHRDLTERGS